MSDELPPGFEFGGYVIQACIGRGGMAHVYHAEHGTLHRAVALKVLDRWVLDKPAGSQRFLREARTAAAIKHPNVVDIVDVGVWQERPYIIMELLSGCDLESHLDQHGALSDSEVAAIALPVIAGMMAVHEAGVVHRDIKPSNIFLCNAPDGEVVPKVLDFGISKFSDSLNEPVQGPTKTREIVGTPTYMAPEALNGVRELGSHADQYALGAVLYECAVGRPPFEGETLLELLKSIALGNVAPPRSIRPGISITLEDAISRAMNAKPEARFATLRDLGRALWPLADDRTRTIWARSFGNGVSPKTLDQTAGFELMEQNRKRPSPLRRWLPWLPTVAAAGVLGAFFFFRPDAPRDLASSGAGRAAPAVERRSLWGEAPSSSPTAADPVRAAEEAPRTEATAPQQPTAGLDTATAKRPKATRPREPRSTTLDSSSFNVLLGDKAPKPALSARSDKPKRAPADEDADLDQLFAPPRSPEDADSVAGADPELRGLFPAEKAGAVGSNESPLLD
jgi:serine/threonine protein kinase